MPLLKDSTTSFISLFEQGSTPATPASGQQKLFIDSADGHLKRVDDAAAVTDLEDATIAADSVTNTELANMAAATIKGRASGAGTGDPTDLTATQATAILNPMVGDSGSGGTKGLAPAPAAGDSAAGKFLKADGTWATPSGTGAPSSAQYVTLATDGGLSAERVLTAGSGISITDGGANGNVTIAATGSSAGLVLLEQHTASSSATLDFTTFISSTYDTYVFELVNVLAATSADNLYMRVGTGAGPSWDTGSNYAWAGWASNHNSATGASGGSSQAQMQLSASASNSAAEGLSGTVKLYDPQNTSHGKNFTHHIIGIQSSGNFNQTTGGARWTTSGTAMTGVRFYYSSGNIASGVIRCYGVAK